MELVEAQDYILEVLGSSPTGDITSSNPDAQAARAALKRISKSVQKTGWWFNTDHNVIMEPAPVSKEILLPVNVLKIVPYGSDNQKVVQRGIKLYDSINNSYQFDRNITAARILNLDWDLLPYDVQETVQFSAASELCSTDLEDSIKAAEQRDLATAALLEVRKTHLKVSKKNALTSPAAARFRSRIRPYRR